MLSWSWQLRYEILGAMAGWHGTSVFSVLLVACLLLIFGSTVGRNLHNSCQAKRPPVVISKYALLSFFFSGQQQHICMRLVVCISHDSLVFVLLYTAADWSVARFSEGGCWQAESWSYDLIGSCINQKHVVFMDVNERPSLF